MPAMAHRITLRVYYEDTDLAGIVYYANYLKYIERGRTEFVRALGVDQGRLKREAGLVFAVRRLAADYLKPAVFDDLLSVETAVRSVTGARLVMAQRVLRGDLALFAAEVTLTTLSADGRPRRFPTEIRRALEARLAI